MDRTGAYETRWQVLIDQKAVERVPTVVHSAWDVEPGMRNRAQWCMVGSSERLGRCERVAVIAKGPSSSSIVIVCSSTRANWVAGDSIFEKVEM